MLRPDVGCCLGHASIDFWSKHPECLTNEHGVSAYPSIQYRERKARSGIRPCNLNQSFSLPKKSRNGWTFRSIGFTTPRQERIPVCACVRIGNCFGFAMRMSRHSSAGDPESVVLYSPNECRIVFCSRSDEDSVWALPQTIMLVCR